MQRRGTHLWVDRRGRGSGSGNGMGGTGDSWWNGGEVAPMRCSGSSGDVRVDQSTSR